MKLKELTLGPPKIILYGDVGTGKTTFALTCGKDALVCDFEAGLRSGLSVQDAFTQDRVQVEVRQFLDDEPNKRSLAFNAFKRFIYDLPASIKAGKFPYKVIIIDSLTSMSESAVRYVVGNSGSPTDSPEIQEWGLAFIEIKNVLAVLRSLPIAVIVIAHDETRSKVKGERREDHITLAISGKKMDKEVSRYFDEIWYCRLRHEEGGKSSVYIQTSSDYLVTARSRASLKGFNANIGMRKVLETLGYPLDKEVTNVATTSDTQNS